MRQVVKYLCRATVVIQIQSCTYVSTVASFSGRYSSSNQANLMHI